MNKVILAIIGGTEKIFPLKSAGREKIKVVRIHCQSFRDFWGPDGRPYKGEEDPVLILIDSSSFEPKVLANYLTEIIDKLQSWHPDIPILQLEYRF